MKNVLVVGASGFVGSHVVRLLAARGANVLAPTRRRERAKHLITHATVDVVEADVHDDATLARLLAGQDAVVNLVGVLDGGRGKPYGRAFARAHVELPRRIAQAARAAGVGRLVHMSALKADAEAPSGYLRSKAAGEAAVRAVAADMAVTVLRPSVIFGQGDSFLSLFAGLQRRLPVLPLACPAALFQPVWVEDVAASVVDSLYRPGSRDQAYELCGPRIYTLLELVRYAGRISGRPSAVLCLPDLLSYLQAWAMEFVPGGPMTRDNYWSLQVPSTCDHVAAGQCSLPFGRQATPLESVAPSYLADDGHRGAANDDFRRTAHR